MSVYEKLLQARIRLQESPIKKSGKNQHLKFDYMELEDFLPTINKINLELKLFSGFTMDQDSACLTLRDTESPNETARFESPLAIAKLQGNASPIQELGAQHTYMRRYLYLMAYEICENDVLDGTIGHKVDKTPDVPKPPKQEKKPEPTVTYITPDQAVHVANECADTESDIKEVMKFFNIPVLDKMTAEQLVKFDKLMATKRKQKAEQK